MVAAACYPETNVLVGIDEHDVKSHTPMSKFIEVSLELERQLALLVQGVFTNLVMRPHLFQSWM